MTAAAASVPKPEQTAALAAPAVGGARVPSRRDSRATRARLVRAVGELLAEQGATFGMPEVAATARTSLATAYRYFSNVSAAYEAFALQCLDDLAESLPPQDNLDALGYFETLCASWAAHALSWGPAYVHVRPSRGVLERLHGGDPVIVRLCSLISPALELLIAGGHVPQIDLDFGLLLWISAFDERALLDLRDGLGLSPHQVAEVAAAAVLAALRAPHSAVRRHPRGYRLTARDKSRSPGH